MIEDKDRLELLYKEYERLHSVVNSYSHSTLDDFKLFGAIGLVLAWPPLAGGIQSGDTTCTTEYLILAGSIAMLVISIVIIMRDALKQSLIIFYFAQTEAYEQQISALLEQTEKGTFQGFQKWNKDTKIRHNFIANLIYFLYFIIVLAFPTATLMFLSKHFQACIYLLVASALCLFPIKAFFRLYKLSFQEFMIICNTWLQQKLSLVKS